MPSSPLQLYTQLGYVSSAFFDGGQYPFYAFDVGAPSTRVDDNVGCFLGGGVLNAGLLEALGTAAWNPSLDMGALLWRLAHSGGLLAVVPRNAADAGAAQAARDFVAWAATRYTYGGEESSAPMTRKRFESASELERYMLGSDYGARGTPKVRQGRGA